MSVLDQFLLLCLFFSCSIQEVVLCLALLKLMFPRGSGVR